MGQGNFHTLQRNSTLAGSGQIMLSTQLDFQNIVDNRDTSMTLSVQYINQVKGAAKAS